MKRKKLIAILSLIFDEYFNDDDGVSSIAAMHRELLTPATALIVLMKGKRTRHFRLGHLSRNTNDWIGRYLDVDFHHRFRMKKDTFWALVEVVRPWYPLKLIRGDAPLVKCHQAVLMTLSYLGHESSMDDVGDRFGVTSSTVHKEVHRIVKILCSLKSKFIVWPQANECPIVEEQFRQKAGFPGVIGAIDGCHIEILAPAEDQESYTDRKMNHSIILQGVCTATKIFNNVSIGTPGSRNDNRALAFSSLFHKILKDGPRSVTYEERYHLLGDKAYPNRCWLLAPYKNYGELSRRQRRYNYFHSATRTVIEHTFGLLKGRWCHLLCLVLKDVSKDTDFVLAACILHNFCYLHNDTVIEEMETQVRLNQAAQNIGGLNDDVSKQLGHQKREQICDML